MKIIICGAGQVGSSIARQLYAEGHDVAVIENDEQILRRLSDTLEIQTIHGHAAYPDMLERAGVEGADMLIAVTHSDEVNMVACQVAHALFRVPTKIARVRNQNYLKPKWNALYANPHFPIDVVISPEREVARAIMRRLHAPGATDIIQFETTRVKAVGVQCEPGSDVLQLPLRVLMQRLSGTPFRILAVVKEGKMILPHEDMVLDAGDHVYFLAEPRHIQKIMGLFGHTEKEARRIVIIGGGNIGLFVAQELEQEDTTRVKIIEFSRGRAEEVATQLRRTTVVQGSGLDQQILLESHVDLAETLICVTNDDEVNVLASVLSKHLGCQRVLALVNSTSYIPMLSDLGIDAALNPRETTVSSILQHVRRGKIRSVYAIVDGEAELLEVEVEASSPLVGRRFVDVEWPEGVVLGGIIRGETVLFKAPNEVQLATHDRIILLARARVVARIEKIVSSQPNFF
jgi:trk system potassium uptake protein TrkA